MSYLADQQQALVDALFSWPAQNATKSIATYASGDWARGLKAYASNGHMLAERALGAAFPVLAQLIGQESFSALARAFWHAQPPVRGDLAIWGADLPAFLENSAQLQDEPYLPDVAKVEWALHGAATQSDTVASLESLALLTTHDPAALYLRLAPGIFFLRSVWPVASILGAHLYNHPTFAQVGLLLRDQVGQDVVVWREGWRPREKEAQPGELVFLRHLQDGLSLGAALTGAPELNFETWFPAAVQTALVLSVNHRPPEN